MFISLIVALPLWGFLIVWKVYTRFVKKGTDKENEKVSQEEEGVNLKAKIFDEPVWNGLRKRNSVLNYFVSCFSTILPQIKFSQFLGKCLMEFDTSKIHPTNYPTYNNSIFSISISRNLID